MIGTDSLLNGNSDYYIASDATDVDCLYHLDHSI